MAAEITKLPLLKLPTGPAPLTPEQQYWKSFRSQHIVPSPTSYPVTHISFPSVVTATAATPSSNDFFAVTTGTRVQIFSIRTRKVVKVISRFSDIARSGEIRRDGRVMVAGDDTGRIQVFDVGSRAILKTWAEHQQPVWVTRFSPTDLTTILSASDDRSVRLWDLPSQKSTVTMLGHTDYVRTAHFMPGAATNMLVSGSYDETVRLWDPRVPNKAAMTFKHAAPIEAVLPMPSGTTVLAAADNQISVLDIVAGKPSHILKNHQKTVTSLCLASNSTRLVSGGLDGHVKVFETSAWNVVAGSKYPSPILSVSVVSSGATNEDRHLVVGMQSGMLSIRTRLSGQQKAKERERAKEMQALLDGKLEEYDKKKKRSRNADRRLRGMDFMGEGVDVVIAGNERRRFKETQWERDLRKGKYAQALDGVLGLEHASSITVLTVLTALRHRSAMREALQNRDELSVQPIMKWVYKHITDPRYVSVCVDAALLLLDLYSEHVGSGSADLDQSFRLLHRRVRQEVEQAQLACQTSGMLEMLVAGSA